MMRRVASSALALALSVLSPGQAAPYDGYLVVVGDTQWLTASDSWWRTLHNKAYAVSRWDPSPWAVLQVGDCSQNALPSELWRARLSFDLWTRAGIPWMAVAGNHDSSTGHACPFVPRFPCWDEWRARFGDPWKAMQVDHGTRFGDFTVLGLPFGWTDYSINWLRDWMDTHATEPVLINTHSFLNRAGPVYSQRPNGALDLAGEDRGEAGTNSALTAFRKLCEHYPQIFAVVCGHASGQSYNQFPTIHGGQVTALLHNIQGTRDGSVLMVAVEDRRWDCYSIAFEVNTAINPTWYYEVTLDRTAEQLRQDLRRRPVWRARRDRWTDTWVANIYGGTRTNPGAQILYANGSGDREHILMRPDLSGVPIAPTSVVLTLVREGYDTGGDNVHFHRMLRPWNEGDSWASLGGLRAGMDYEATPDFVLTGSRGTKVFDLTASWGLRGPPIHGWVGVGQGRRRSGIRSSEHPEGPVLSVR